MSLDLDLEQFHDHLNHTGIAMDDLDSQDADPSTYPRQNQADKRAHHNALERKRRDHIKGSFSDLRDVVPSLKGEKVGTRLNAKKSSDGKTFLRHLALMCSKQRRNTFAA